MNKNELKQKYLKEAEQARKEAQALRKIEIKKNADGLYFGGKDGRLTQRAITGATVAEYIGYAAGCLRIYVNNVVEVHTYGYIDELPTTDQASKPLTHGKGYTRQHYTLTPDELQARLVEWAESKELYAAQNENAAAVVDEAYEIARTAFEQIGALSDYQYLTREFFTDLIIMG